MSTAILCLTAVKSDKIPLFSYAPRAWRYLGALQLVRRTLWQLCSVREGAFGRETDCCDYSIFTLLRSTTTTVTPPATSTRSLRRKVALERQKYSRVETFISCGDIVEQNKSKALDFLILPHSACDGSFP